jgi:hypothetical protein
MLVAPGWSVAGKVETSGANGSRFGIANLLARASPIGN